MDNLEIIKTKIHELDDDLLEKFLDYQEIKHESDKQDHVLRTRKYRKKRIQIKPSPQQTREDYIALSDDKIIATALCSFQTLEQENNPDTMWAEIFVLPNYRQKGIGRAMLRKIIEFAEEHNKQKIETGFYPSDFEFSEIYITEKLGFKLGFTEQVSRIYRDKINWDYIKQQEEKLTEIPKRYDIIGWDRKEYGKILTEDDEMAEKLADFYTEADNLLPKENAEWNDVKYTAEDMRVDGQRMLETIEIANSFQFIAFDNGIPIAYSGTHFPNDPPVQDVGTGLTAVRKAYQGKGIAKFLKMSMLRHYVDNYPEFEYISTENAGTNAGMLHINHSLGFTHHTDWHFYQGTVEGIQNYLG